MTTNLAAVEARAITDRIKATVSDAWDLIEQAYAARVWDALGYDSWDHYCLTEFGTTRLRLPRDERREVVASMREVGMSTRAIASAVGVDAKTVRTDLAEPGGEFSPPAVPPVRREPMNMPTAESAEPAPAPLGTPVPIVTGTDGKTYAAAAPQPKRAKKQTNIRGTIADALTDIARARNTLTALNREQLTAQDEEARRLWAANLSESIEALTGFANQLTKES